MTEVVKVERVVIGPYGDVYRAASAKRRLEQQKADGQQTWARLGIAPVAITPTDKRTK